MDQRNHIDWIERFAGVSKQEHYQGINSLSCPFTDWMALLALDKKNRPCHSKDLQYRNSGCMRKASVRSWIDRPTTFIGL